SHTTIHHLSTFSSFFFYCYAHPPNLHSFPTRRSSDLVKRNLGFDVTIVTSAPTDAEAKSLLMELGVPFTDKAKRPQAAKPADARSEEHTSELQSLAYLVCRLLLEKKKYNTS